MVRPDRGRRREDRRLLPGPVRLGDRTRRGGYQDWLLDGGQPWAGTVPAGAVPAGNWIPYVAVDNLAVAVSKAVDLGGTVIRDTVTGPAGSSVIVADPGGALIALFTPAAG
jgi:uncharacterized protein